MKTTNLISRRSCELYWAEPWLSLWRALEAQGLAAEFLRIQYKGNSLRLLDAGSGDGRFFDLLSYAIQLLADRPLPVTFHAFGLEQGRKRSLGMRKRGSLLVPVRGDVTALPFKAHVMDAVLCNSVLEHIEDVDLALAEFSRVLRPNGYLLFTVPSVDFERKLLRYRLGRWIGKQRAERLAKKKSARMSHFHYLNPVSWEQHLVKNAFSMIYWRPIVPNEVVAWGDMLQVIRDVGIGGGYTSLRRPRPLLTDLAFRIVRRVCIELEVRIAKIANRNVESEVEGDEGAYLIIAQRTCVNLRARNSCKVITDDFDKFSPLTVMA
jgi:SAM-dependent methyltransferase